MKPIYKFILFIALFSIAKISFAQITFDKARQIANAFMQNECPTEVKGVYNNNVMQPFYIFNYEDTGGFVIVSGLDEKNPILGYSDSTVAGADIMPEALRFYLDNYYTTKDQCSIDAVMRSVPVVDALCKTEWSQREPYNGMCPFVGASRCLTGCGATALSQILYYHKHPEYGIGAHSYVWSYVNNAGDTIRNTIRADFSSHKYDWDNMLYKYVNGAYTQTQADAVALLMNDVGIGSEMEYGVDASGVVVSKMPRFLIENLRYDPSTMGYVARDGYEGDWFELLFDELDACRPIIYAGRPSEGAGHVFVIDGYDSNQMFHVNWGWNGVYNGWFDLSRLIPASNAGDYTYEQRALYGIQPLLHEIDIQGVNGITINPGIRLWNYVNAYATHKENVKRLLLKGHIDYRDFRYIRDSLINMESLDFTGCKIDAYSSINADEVPSWALAKCAKLRSVVLPNVKSIDYAALYSCESLESVVIPESVTNIGEYAFASCSSLLSVKIPDNVASIGSYTFDDCSSLSSVELPKNMAYIGNNVFRGCINLKEVVLPNGVDSIRRSSFNGCTSLGKVELGESVCVIDSFAFYNCSSMKKIALPNSVLRINYAAFNGCEALEKVDFGESLKVVDSYAFNKCSSLTEIILPSSVTRVNYAAFNGCEALGRIDIGSGTEFIDSFAFTHKSGYYATEVICRAVTPPLCMETAFGSATYRNATLYVPEGCGDVYRNASEWSKFKTIVEFSSSSINDAVDRKIFFNRIERTISVPGVMEGKTVRVFSVGGLLVKQGMISNGFFSLDGLYRGVFIIEVDGNTYNVSL